MRLGEIGVLDMENEMLENQEGVYFGLWFGTWEDMPILTLQSRLGGKKSLEAT